jgi:hypothetical protein
MTRSVILLAIVFTAVTVTGEVRPAQAAQEGIRTVAAAEPQVKDDLFAGTEKFAQGATDVTDVNLDPEMLGMVGGEKSGDLARKMNFIIVHSYHYPRPGMYKMEDVEPYRQKLRTGSWNCFIHVSESRTGESTDICRHAAPNNQGNEMVIITAEPMELTFIHVSGTASLSDLGKLGAFGGGGAPNKNTQSPASPVVPK